MTTPNFLPLGAVRCGGFSGGPRAFSAYSFTARWNTVSAYRIAPLPLLVCFLLVAPLAIGFLSAGKSSFYEYEQSVPMPEASLENETKSVKDIVVGKASDSDAVRHYGVSFQDKYHGQAQGEPVLVSRWPEHELRQELLRRPPP